MLLEPNGAHFSAVITCGVYVSLEWNDEDDDEDDLSSLTSRLKQSNVICF